MENTVFDVLRRRVSMQTLSRDGVLDSSSTPVTCEGNTLELVWRCGCASVWMRCKELCGGQVLILKHGCLSWSRPTVTAAPLVICLGHSHHTRLERWAHMPPPWWPLALWGLCTAQDVQSTQDWLEPCVFLSICSFLLHPSSSVFVCVSFCVPCPFAPPKTTGALRGCQEKEKPLLFHCLYLNKYGLSGAPILKTAASILEESKGCTLRHPGPSKVPTQLLPSLLTLTQSKIFPMCKGVYDLPQSIWPTVGGVCTVMPISSTGAHPEPSVSHKNYEQASDVTLQPALMSFHGFLLLCWTVKTFNKQNQSRSK